MSVSNCDCKASFSRRSCFSRGDGKKVKNRYRKITPNTIPAKILDRELLNYVNSDSLIIDLASKPGGIDFGAAKELGKNVIWALSLPGKTAPITAGNIIYETICEIITEEGIDL